jgi:flagella basal body P-ring formation protein FlgA
MNSRFAVRATVSLLLVSLWSFFLPAAFADDPPSADTQVVVVPKFDLEKGSTPTESSLEEKKIEKRLAPVNAVAGISEVVGRTLKRKKMKGAIIMLDDLARPGDKLD